MSDGTQNTATSNDGSQKVVFTTEQQEKVNELIRAAMGRAGNEHREHAAKLESELQATRKELEDAKTALSKAKTPSERNAAKADIDALNAQIEEMRRASQSTADEANRLKEAIAAKERELSTARQETINIRKANAIANAASKINFVNAEVVQKLVADNIKYDEKAGRFVVLSETGQERLNASFEPMSLDEYMQEFASKNPYLVRGTVVGGTGSAEAQRHLSMNGKYEVAQIFGKNSNSMLAAKLAKEDIKEYRRLKAIAKESGLIA